MSYNFTQCQFLNGFADENNVFSCCFLNGTEEDFFLAVKDESGNFNTNAIFIFKEYGNYVIGERENYDLATQANIFRNYMPKNDLLNYLNGLDRQYTYFYMLTQEQFDLLITTIQNS